MYGNGMGLGLGWIWVLVLLLGLAALVWVFASVATSTGGRRAPVEAGARDIIRQRFARGEITEAEMRTALRALDES